MESWNLPFQISRSCEVGITDNVSIVIGLISWRMAESSCLASCELIIALLLTEREHLAKRCKDKTQLRSLPMKQNMNVLARDLYKRHYFQLIS